MKSLSSVPTLPDLRLTQDAIKSMIHRTPVLTNQFINILRSILDSDVDNYKFNKVLDNLKKGDFNINDLEFHEILDIWTLFRDLQELKIDVIQYTDIIKQLKKQTKKHKPGMYAFKKHGGNHIKRTHKKKHGPRKSIRNIRHNRRRTRKT